LLLLLDNCEHVLPAAARLCAGLLRAADDVRVLATSRELLGVAGEAGYRLRPLRLPGSGDQGDGGESEAMALFADRARRVDRGFTLSGQSTRAVERIVAQLDGMPLAIELAAARVEALSLGRLADGIDDYVRAFASRDPLAPERHRSLAAVAGWSYRLLGEAEQRVFRRLAVFPAPFTLEAAAAVAGDGAREAVLRLVDCSLLVPPQPGLDGRARYVMLQTLRDFGLARLAEAGEWDGAWASMAGFERAVAEQASAALESAGEELAGAVWLASEEANLSQALAWSVDNEPATALRLAICLAPWWSRQGRASEGHELLGRVLGHVPDGGQAWCAARFWLGVLAPDPFERAGLEQFSAVRDALAAAGPSPLLVRALNGRSMCLGHLRRYAEATQDAKAALAMAAGLGWPAGEAISLISLAVLAHYAGDNGESLTCLRQAQRIDPASLPDEMAREARLYLARALNVDGALDEARQLGAEVLQWARRAAHKAHEAEVIPLLPDLDMQAGRWREAGQGLCEAFDVVSRIGNRYRVLECLDLCGHWCVRTGRHAEAITVWAARAAHCRDYVIADLPLETARIEDLRRGSRQVIGSARAAAAQARGQAMTLDTAVEYALLVLQAAGPADVLAAPRLSARERQLIGLVAAGRTDAQIAAELFISIRTVRSHLDRIGAKTGCRRRADLTRLALRAGVA
jgi:predicted ATPase/DNA-binding CsgD family transcriptional regulator